MVAVAFGGPGEGEPWAVSWAFSELPSQVSVVPWDGVTLLLS